ncbi:MAG: tetratricopeptide repeat protein, partial [Planctomycetota bacterium]
MRTFLFLILCSAPALAGDADQAARLVEKGDYAKAEAAARKLVEAEPLNTDGWLVLADAMAGQADKLEGWERQGRYGEAAEALEGALDRIPKDPRLPLKLGDLYVKLAEAMARLTGRDNDVQGYYADAIRMYRAALERDAKSADADSGLAYVTYASGKGVEPARAHLSSCLGISKDHAGAHALQAELFYREKRYAEAA